MHEILVYLENYDFHEDLPLEMHTKNNGWDSHLVDEHIDLLEDDDLIEHFTKNRTLADEYRHFRLTMAGHDCLEELDASILKKIGWKILDVSGKCTWLIVGAGITWFVTFTLSKLYGGK
ncbi:MAG: hypothetical protein COB76_00160 [Alphaproteobacteria bacterium]|nr:MAG: hypothetical protein COB76_00160 [Alphaproteobacteria bacterium]